MDWALGVSAGVPVEYSLGDGVLGRERVGPGDFGFRDEDFGGGNGASDAYSISSSWSDPLLISFACEARPGVEVIAVRH